MPDRNPFRLAIVLLLFIAAPVASRAELLPIRAYTSAGELASYEVEGVEADSRGFVWFYMADGLSRFDGYAFTTYTAADGLPSRRVMDFVETHAGEYYAATAGGLARFDPSGGRGTERPPFVRVPFGDDTQANSLNEVIEARDGTLWIGSDGGLYRIEPGGPGSRVDLGAAGPVFSVFQDRHGDVWAGTYGQVRRVRLDGRVETYTMPKSFAGAGVERVFEDAAERLWVCTHAGGMIASARASVDDPVVFDQLKSPEKFGWLTAYLRGSDGTEWIASTSGLWRLASEAREPSLVRVPSIAGACVRELWDIAEDHDGNLWLAMACGALRVDWRGCTSYGVSDGLASDAVNSIFETRSGDLVVTTLDNGRVVNRFDGERFVAVRPTMPEGVIYAGWGWGQTILQARDGAWWVPTGHGALRYPSTDGRETALGRHPERVTRDSEAFRLFEDSRGDVWIVTLNWPGLLEWVHSTNRVVDHSEETGVGRDANYTAFAETRGGALWIATSGVGLLRYAGGRFERFRAEQGAPTDFLRSLHVDDAGRLWIASNLSGLVRVDDPDAERPTFTRYTMSDGLASENTYCVTSDAWGNVYVGLPRGVDRLDPATGRVKHFTTDDGLPKGAVQIAYRDRHGRLWFGAKFGLARLDPAPDRRWEPPRAVVTGLRVAGVGRAVSALGETSVGGLDLGPSENSVSVDFLGIGASLGEELRYQYRLEGAIAEWSAPIAERTVTFANLGAGSYRLLVRAVDADGLIAGEPAAVAFTIAAPVWRRWWFLALVGVLACGLAYGLHRNRVAKALAVERVRTRIASDLHDDIGTNLTKIAVLSEVANHRLGGGGDDSIAAIAAISRESVAAMNDIVWAVNPGRDGVLDLSRRMRQFANDAFAPTDVDVQFGASEVDEARLDDELRRHVYLIFKEAVTNAVRHSGCSRVEVSLAIDRRELRLTVADDGRGFDISEEADGNGLANMRKRAAAVGAALDVRSGEETGTTVTLTVPIARGRLGAARSPRSHVRDDERRAP
jgi:signal transduction histidine kinase/ligand-binding sensor domain-containing protein